MAFLLLIPFLGARFGLLALLDREAVGRAAYFAPMPRAEKPAYWLYQLSNVGILVLLLFLRVYTTPPGMFWAGLAVYGAGILLLVVSVVYFAASAEGGVRQNGVYRLSRNPMYLAYFLVFMGCVLLTQSLLLLGFVAIFQITAHWIIRAEERWCTEQFGEEYRQYMNRVRRYL